MKCCGERQCWHGAAGISACCPHSRPSALTTRPASSENGPVSTPELHRPPVYACHAGAVLHGHSADTLEPAVVLWTFLPAGGGDRLDALDAKVDVHGDGPGTQTLTVRVLSEGQSLSWQLPIAPFVAALPGQPGDDGRMVLLAVMDAEPETGFWAQSVDCERLGRRAPAARDRSGGRPARTPHAVAGRRRRPAAARRRPRARGRPLAGADPRDGRPRRLPRRPRVRSRRCPAGARVRVRPEGLPGRAGRPPVRRARDGVLGRRSVGDRHGAGADRPVRARGHPAAHRPPPTPAS